LNRAFVFARRFGVTPQVGHQELPDGLAVTFTPHLLPIDQGLLASCYVTPKSPLTGDEVRELFLDAYAGEPFVELADAPPGVRDVRETNLCRV
jgi:N-acetyl-gamma-glutamyl-phosphate reductase